MSVVPIKARPYQGRTKMVRSPRRNDAGAGADVEIVGGDGDVGTAARADARISSSLRSSSGRIRSAHTPVALTTTAARTSKRSPVSVSVQATLPPFPLRPGSPPPRRGWRAPRRTARPRRGSSTRGGRRPSGSRRRGRPSRGEAGRARNQLSGLLAADRPMAVRSPVVGLLGALAALASPPADPRGGHHVVHVQPDPDSKVAAVVP